jgi:hypothetical protein
MKEKIKKWKNKFRCPCGGTVIQEHWKQVSGGGFSWKPCNKCEVIYTLKDVEDERIKKIN